MVTRLERFIRANRIKPSRLARVAGASRQYVLRLRLGVMDPTRHMMTRLTMASAILLGRLVAHEELFEMWETGLRKRRRVRRHRKTRRKAKR